MVVILKDGNLGHGGRDIVHRWEGNPLINISTLGFKCSDILNAGVVVFEEQVILLVTVEHLSGQKKIHLARPGLDGRYIVDEEPLIGPSINPKYGKYESQGVLDARVTFLEGVYYIFYNALSEHGYRLGLAKTKDFKSVARLGMISEPDTKAGVLFPERIRGRYARLEKPCEGHCIWISYSDDLRYWGDSEMVIAPRAGYWDASRIGPGGSVIAIEQGWLVLYYGAKDTSSGPIYRLGAVILDRDEPTKVIGRAGIPILSPRENYERIGDVPNIVFSTGAIMDDQGNLEIFYGAANSCICIGMTTVNEVVANCMESEKEY